MKSRLAQTVGRKAERIHISTIHSFCKSMLEDYFKYHRYGAEINVIDEVTQMLILELNKQKFGYAKWSKSKGRVVFVKNDFDFLSEVKSLYDKMTNNNITSNILFKALNGKGILIDEDKKIIEGYDKYVNYLETDKKMDFSMLQSRFYNLMLQYPQVAEELDQRFQFVLVDEYQDTSPIQDLIFEKISKHQQNLFVVGDENQSIYGFRGANVENFRRFNEKYPDAKEYLLNVNFRSTKTIVDLSNELFKKELRKALECKRKQGNKIKLIYENSSDDMAKATVRLIKELHSKKIIQSYGDVAFLFRSLKYHSEEFINHLVKEKIPYITFGDGKFLEREEVQTMLLSLSYITSELYLDPKLSEWSKWWRRDMFLTEIYNFSEETKKIIKEGDFKLYDLIEETDFTKNGFKNKNDINVLIKLNGVRAEVTQKKETKANDEGTSLLLDIFYKILDISGYFSRLVDNKTNDSKEKLQNLAK